GKLADRGRGVEPLTHIRPIYCAHAVLMASLVVAHWVPVYGALLLVVLGMFMYLQNSASQVLYMDVASQSHPGSLNLAASLNSMSFNIGIALGSAVGGLINGHFGLMWLGPVGALFLVCAIAITTFLRPFVAQERDFYADI
ncbi:MAG TPA: MFS transporter, partial [Bifidobacterium longum]|nr:MFS transporter [Bifidobacterium longum]